MAKPKIKFDAAKIQTFLVEHGEKIGFGVIVLVFLMLIYGIFGVDRLDTTPQDLRSKVTQARENLERSQLNVKEAGIVVKDYSTRAQEVTRDVLLAGYDWRPVNPSVWPPGAKRRKPELLAVESIEIHTGQAAFDLRPESEAIVQNQPNAQPNTPQAPRPGGFGGGQLGGGLFGAPAGGTNRPASQGEARPAPATTARNAEGLRYAVVLGLVPIERQIKLFEDAFQGVAFPRPETDRQPRFRSVGSGLAAWVQRAEVKPGVADEDLKWEYLDVAPEKNNRIIKARYNGVRPELANQNAIDPLLADPLPPITGMEWTAEMVVHSQIPVAPQRDQQASTTPTAATPSSPAAPLPPGMAPMEEPAEAADEEEPETDEIDYEDTPYLLFRYFDFTAEAGKTYKYRVMLAFENPNYEIDESYLAERDLGKKEVVHSPLSGSSGTATLPFDGSLFAGEIVPPTAAYEMAVKLAVEQWLTGGGRARHVIDRVFRGRVANFQLDPAVLVKPGGSPTLSEKGTPHPVRTELAVLDMMGEGEVAKGPARVLLMDSSGRLSIRTASADEDRFGEIEQNLKEATEASKKPDSRRQDQLGTQRNSRAPAAGTAPAAGGGNAVAR